MSITPENIGTVEGCLGYVFNDKNLLIRALTRKSYAQEQQQQGKVCEDQEVYCTWGDALLKSILVELLFRQGYVNAGSITDKKSQLEQRQSLGTMPIALSIASFMRLNAGDKKQQIHRQPSVIGETFEAVIAAIYVDSSYERLKELVEKWFAERI